MYESEVLELEEGSKHLLGDGTDIFEGQRLKFVLFEEIIEVLFQHLKDQASVVLVLEALMAAHKIEFVGIFLTEPGQYADLNLPLPCIRRVVLEDFDGDYFICALLPALDHLAKCAAPKELENLVGICHAVQDLMLYQLIVPLTVGGVGVLGRRRGGGCVARLFITWNSSMLYGLDPVVHLLTFALQTASLVGIQ